MHFSCVALLPLQFTRRRILPGHTAHTKVSCQAFTKALLRLQHTASNEKKSPALHVYHYNHRVHRRSS